MSPEEIASYLMSVFESTVMEQGGDVDHQIQLADAAAAEVVNRLSEFREGLNE